MSCYHPLKGIVLGVRPDGKKNIKIIKSENLDFINKNDYCEIIDVPCGHCIGCRLDYSREWANRCMLEMEDHDKACFITLTYNDEHLPVANKIIDDTGRSFNSPIHPLVKSDLQKFWKRLRKAFPDTRIRYFCCGEYGSTTYRPHYHAIVYGVDFSEDRQVLKKDSEFTYYVSPKLSRLWSDPETKEELGYHIIADVNWNTAAYCARYAVKKLSNDYKGFYENYNIPREFASMSRRPGIGRNYYDKHVNDIYRNDEIFINVRDGGRKIQAPRYYDRILECDDPVLFESVKRSRQDRAQNRSYQLSEMVEKSYIDYLKTLEDNKVDQVKVLSRKEV